MFAIVKNNVIEKLLQAGSAFMHDDGQYPANWINLAKPEEKAAIGMVDVVRSDRPDDRFYWVSESAPVYNAETNQVEVGYEVTAKDLDACKAVATSGVKSAAYALLAPTDYIDIRNLRDATYKPEWMTWRDAVRAAATAASAAIESCADVDALAALPAVEWPANPDQQPAV